MSAHWGIGYRGSKPLLRNGRPVAGVDMKSFEEHNWNIDTSVKAASSSVSPPRGVAACASWPSGTRGMIRADSFTIIRSITMALGCLLGGDRVSRGGVSS
jgi:hypothetical protein